jgi:hypothetical protein
MNDNDILQNSANSAMNSYKSIYCGTGGNPSYTTFNYYDSDNNSLTSAPLSSYYPSSISKEALEDLLDKDDEIMPIIKSYLYKYLETAITDEFLDDLLKQYKEGNKKEVYELKEKIKDLEIKIKDLESLYGTLYARLSALEQTQFLSKASNPLYNQVTC